MKWTNLDRITNSVLINKNLSLHYYLQFLKFSCDCIRFLAKDSLKIINTVELSINQTSFATNLPCDYVDYVTVGIPQGQFVKPVTQRDTVNNLANYNTFGQVQPFGEVDISNLQYPFYPGYWMFQNIDDLGENTGRLFGFSPGNNNDFFKIIPSRGQIQFSQLFPSCKAILVYVSDGQCADTATHVDTRAQDAIEQYINWKRSKNADIERSPEGMSFYNQRRLLRANLNDLTIADIRQAIFKSYIQSPKT